MIANKSWFSCLNPIMFFLTAASLTTPPPPELFPALNCTSGSWTFHDL